MITLTQEQFDKTILAVAKRDAMLAIRIVADIMNWGLRDAKDYVQNLLEI